MNVDGAVTPLQQRGGCADGSVQREGQALAQRSDLLAMQAQPCFHAMMPGLSQVIGARMCVCVRTRMRVRVSLRTTTNRLQSGLCTDPQGIKSVSAGAVWGRTSSRLCSTCTPHTRTAAARAVLACERNRRHTHTHLCTHTRMPTSLWTGPSTSFGCPTDVAHARACTAPAPDPASPRSSCPGRPVRAPAASSWQTLSATHPTATSSTSIPLRVESLQSPARRLQRSVCTQALSLGATDTALPSHPWESQRLPFA